MIRRQTPMITDSILGLADSPRASSTAPGFGLADLVIKRLVVTTLAGMSLVFTGLTGCAHKEVSRSQLPVTSPPVNADQDTVETKTVSDAERIKTLEPSTIEKAKLVFLPLISDDEKKAKLAYGRAHRALPDILKFVFDMRFKNYDHALTLIDSAGFEAEQRDFWRRVVGSKPKHLAAAICQDLRTQGDYPTEKNKIAENEAAWFAYFEDLTKQTVEKTRKNPRMRGDLDEAIDKIPCNEKVVNPVTGLCGPVPEEMHAEILNDQFFDNLHNMKRRDARAAAQNAKSLMKQGLYDRYVSAVNILKLWRAIKADTGYDRQAHFLRRFTSIARDMRSESGLSRALGDLIVGDTQDLAFARRLNHLMNDNSLTIVTAGIAYDLAQCDLPKQVPKVSVEKGQAAEQDETQPSAESAGVGNTSASPSPSPAGASN